MPRRELAACALWVAALTFMIFGTIETLQEGRPSPALAWALFLAIGALVPTGWCLLRRECGVRDTEVERIVEIVDTLHEARSSVSKLNR